VQHNQHFVQISVCPTFPRGPLCSSQEVWDFLRTIQLNPATSLADLNSIRRIPDGAGSLTYPNANLPHVTAQYVEISKYGLLFAARQFRVVQYGAADPRPQLYFADLFQTLLKLTVFAERFYIVYGYRGNLLMNISLHHVQGQAMRFLAAGPLGDDDAEDFRCYTDLVSAERLVTVDQIRAQRVDVLTEILSDLTWAFWQSNAELPVARLRQNVEQMARQMGA
jgi:hypothetical protein